MQAIQLSSTRVCGVSRASLRPHAQRPAAAPQRRLASIVRAAADPKPSAQEAEAAQQAATTALLAAAGLLAPLVLDAEAAQAVPELLKGRTFSLMHPGVHQQSQQASPRPAVGATVVPRLLLPV
jgi:hypothetical protein